MSDLTKAVFQKQLTLDTVETQFCSNWLKDQIRNLFSEIEHRQLRLSEMTDDAIRFGRAMEEERNLRLKFQNALENIYLLQDNGSGAAQDIANAVLSVLDKK